jgi:hypothetical protein
MNRRGDIFLAVEAAKKKWPIKESTRVTVLQSRQVHNEKAPENTSGVEARELEAEWITHGWAGCYVEDLDELIIGSIRKRKKWEMAEGEPDWTWER